MTTPPVVLRSLNRPQYVPTPETLISALAWDQLQYTDAELNAVGWRYLGEERPDKKPQILCSYGTSFIERLGPALTDCGFMHDMDPSQLAQAFANGVVGVRSTRGKSQAASPMTPSLALLQNPIGMTGTPRPANFASILEALFRLGSDGSGSGAAELWLGAALQRVNEDPVLGALDRALSQARSPYESRGVVRVVDDASAPWTDTPFGWFHDAWVRLTSPEWVTALPPRTWTDWATTVLRLGVSMGYLWECERYSRVSRAAVEKRADPSSAGYPASESPFELLPWLDGSLPVSSRNVRAIIKRRTYDGGRLHRLLDKWEEARTGEDPDTWLRDPALHTQIQTVLSSQDNPKYLQNIYETVVYSLLRRDLSDHYGLLSARGRAIAVVEPGTEWVAVVASLAAGEPGKETHVGEVVKELGRLGLQPRLPDLIGLLESSGLARGSADADHGVRVDCAF